MTELSQTAQHGLSAHSHGAGVPLQIRSERVRSASVADFVAITQREEQWRYLPTDRLGDLVDDVLAEFSGDIALKAPDSVTTAWVGREHPAFGAAGLPEDRVSASGWASAEAAYLVTIPSNSEPDCQVQLSVVSEDDTASALHVIVEAKTHSKAVVVLDHRGKAVLSENVEILVGDEADLTLVSIQDWDENSVHVASHFCKLGRNSKLKHIVISLGGKTVRITPSVEYTGTGGDAELLGMYFADAGQHLEHRPYIDHSVPNCKSRVTYKGALQGEKAHTVWVGDVLIRKEAEGTDTYELNRNLLLTDGARADSVPNLEIETGKIEGAGHASASGRFDDEQLFYLQARGISESEARRLVVYGFLNEIIQQIGVAEIEARLTESIEAELARSVH
jgi:Fe-S cluster assembly protein SufD